MRNLAGRFQASLEATLTEGANPARLTEAAVALWIQVAAAFSPIIGSRGVEALYRRALSLSVAECPALVAALADTSHADDFVALRAALAGQGGAELVKANGALLRNFFELLATLIGGPLTERLVDHIPGIASSGDPPQETSK